MNKHQVIRSVAVIFVIAVVFTFSNFDSGISYSTDAHDVSNNDFNWHTEMTSELEQHRLQFENEYTFHLEMAAEMKEREHLSVYLEDLDCMIIGSEQNAPCISKNSLLFIESTR